MGRFPCIDPLAERFAWVSSYNYAENEPVGHVDLWGLQKSEPKEETYYGGTLPTVQVEERVSSDVQRDYSVERYGYNGYWDRYKDDYGLDERWTYENYLNYWLEVYSAEHEAWVKAQDEAEAARETVERLTFWMGVVFPTVGGMAMGIGSPTLPSPKSFNFTSILSRNGSSSGWFSLSLSSLGDVQGVPGLYRFPHAGRGYRLYVGQSSNLGVRLRAHLYEKNIGGNILYKPMFGSTKLSREIQETLFIKDFELHKMANIRYPISRARAVRLNLKIY